MHFLFSMPVVYRPHPLYWHMLMRLRMLKLCLGKGRQVIKQLCSRSVAILLYRGYRARGVCALRALVVQAPPSLKHLTETATDTQDTRGTAGTTVTIAPHRNNKGHQGHWEHQGHYRHHCHQSTSRKQQRIPRTPGALEAPLPPQHLTETATGIEDTRSTAGTTITTTPHRCTIIILYVDKIIIMDIRKMCWSNIFRDSYIKYQPTII